MKALLLALLLSAAPAFANQTPQYAYQGGVLQGFHHEQFGRPCVEGSNASESIGHASDEYGNTRRAVDAAATGVSPCANGYSIVYTVTSGEAVYVLTPMGDNDPSKCGLLTRATIPHSVLANQPPHTPIQLRSDGRHFFVKIGNRESEYSAARVQ